MTIFLHTIDKKNVQQAKKYRFITYTYEFLSKDKNVITIRA